MAKLWFDPADGILENELADGAEHSQRALLAPPAGVRENYGGVSRGYRSPVAQPPATVFQPFGLAGRDNPEGWKIAGPVRLNARDASDK